MVEAYGGQFGNKQGYLDHILRNVINATDPQNPTNQETNRAWSILKDDMLAALLISGEDNSRYRALTTMIKDKTTSQGL